MPRRPKPPRRRRRGTGSLSVSADGTIRARLPARLDPRRPAREFPPGQLEAARAWLDAHLSPAPAPEPEAEAVTLGEWAWTWWQQHVEAVRSPNTAHTYRAHLGHLVPLEDTALEDVRTADLQRIVGALTQRVAARTVAAIVGTWRLCLAAAVEDELIRRNPAARLTLPKAAPRPPKRFVTSGEAALLRSAIVGHRFEAAYALLLGCGLRIGEALGLEWRNVKLDKRTALVERQWTNSHWRELPKSKRARTIRLPPAVVAALIRHRNNQPAGATLVMQSPWGGKRSGPIPWSRAAVGSDLARLLVEAGLTRATAHAFRRGLLTALLDGGVSPATAAELAGHTDSSVTLRSYTMPSTEGRERAAEVVDRYLSGEAPEGDSGAETA